jgi:hypothetical protein
MKGPTSSPRNDRHSPRCGSDQGDSPDATNLLKAIDNRQNFVNKVLKLSAKFDVSFRKPAQSVQKTLTVSVPEPILQ